MPVFKCILKILRANITFFLIYIIGLSFMGIGIASSLSSEPTTGAFEIDRATYAVVDRDKSALSEGVAAFLGEHGDAVAVEDDEFALQNVIAKGAVDYLLVIPAGYGEQFAQAVRDGKELPAMDAAYSFISLAGIFMDQQVDGYVSLVRTLMTAHPHDAVADLTTQAAKYFEDSVDASYISTAVDVSAADQFSVFLGWSIYTLFTGIVVCVGNILGVMGRPDLRRRNLASALPQGRYNLQLALGCLVITLVSWGWTFGLGIAVYHDAAFSIGLAGVALCGAAMLALCLFAFSFALILGQSGASLLACNAWGNIVGLVIAFLGGTWVPLSLMSSEVLAVAHWLPGYWYSSALEEAITVGATPTLAGALPALQCIGVLLLFAAACFCISLVVARLRAQTSEAGGNLTAPATLS